MFWLNEAKNSGCQDKVQQWHYAINVLSVFTEGYSPETTGPNADAKLVRERMPIAGLTPAIRLGLNDPEFAKQLFEGGIDEKQHCATQRKVKMFRWMTTMVKILYIGLVGGIKHGLTLIIYICP